MRIIAGRWRGHRLTSVKGKGVRPTTDRVREAWMSALAGRVEGTTVVDLFAGSGALGLEALSRGALHATFVERSRAAVRVLRKNVELLDARAVCSVVVSDVFRYLARRDGLGFDLALADPPYAAGDAERLVAAFVRTPFARELWLEHPSRADLPLPRGARTRRYGDTALSTLTRDP